MANLLGNHDATRVVLTLDSALDVGSYPAPFTIDSENVLVTGGDNTAAVSVVRGANGTAAVSHTGGTALVSGWDVTTTPTLAEVLAAGNDVGEVEGSTRYIIGPASSGNTGASLGLGLAAVDEGGTGNLYGGEARQSGAAGTGGTLHGDAGGGWDGAAYVEPATITLFGGAANGTPGLFAVQTNGATGAAGQSLNPNGAGALVYGGIPSAAGVPSGAPNGLPPWKYDTTAISGGMYFWNGAAWVKITTIL